MREVADPQKWRCDDGAIATADDDNDGDGGRTNANADAAQTNEHMRKVRRLCGVLVIAERGGGVVVMRPRGQFTPAPATDECGLWLCRFCTMMMLLMTNGLFHARCI